MTTISITEDARSLAVEQLRRSRKLKLRLAAFVLGMLVLTPVWLVSEYLRAGGWPHHLSTNGNPGDWHPWLIWVGLAWGFYVAMSAIGLHLHRPASEAEIEHEIARLRGEGR
jgi:hypothetical protein